MKVKISAPDAAGDTAQLGSNIEDAGSVHPRSQLTAVVGPQK